MNYKLKIIRNYWNKPEYANSFTFSSANGSINMYTNTLCVYKLCTNIEFYKFLEENRFDALRIYKRILDSWLEGRIIDYKNKFVHFDLVKYLEKHIGCPFEDTSQFYRDFLELYAVYCNILFERKEINKEEFTDKMKLRKGTGRNKSTINKALSNLNLPYVIKKKNNCWIIEKIPQ